MLAGSDNQIALAFAKTLALIDEGRTLVDGDLLRDSAPPLVATPIAFPAGLLATQGEVQGANHRLPARRGVSVLENLQYFFKYNTLDHFLRTITANRPQRQGQKIISAMIFGFIFRRSRAPERDHTDTFWI